MGELPVPQEALYGAHTARAIKNFPISGRTLQPPFIRAVCLIKAHAARVNGVSGELEPSKAEAIEKAARAVAQGNHQQHLPVDVYQTGSGTSTHMNVNEVIGRLAGAHPNDEVNRGQSSNDIFPTAMHLAALEQLERQLLPAMEALREVLSAKATAFRDVLKIGRTHLQDAVPMSLGQEFSGYARQVECARHRISAAAAGLRELPLGGTAVGTGLNAKPGFARAVIAGLAGELGLPLREAENHFEAQGARDAVVFTSAGLRNYAVAFTKIANDLRWLGSGPHCGLGELEFPAVQPGSSIMPGKINPVIAESTLMVCAQVVGYDATIAWCGASGNLELNTMMPVMAWTLLDAIDLLAAATRNFDAQCVRGMQADRQRTESLVEHSLAMVTALAPLIGYDRAAELAKEAQRSGRTVREVARSWNVASEAELAKLLDPRRQAYGEAG